MRLNTYLIDAGKLYNIPYRICWPFLSDFGVWLFLDRPSVQLTPGHLTNCYGLHNDHLRAEPIAAFAARRASDCQTASFMPTQHCGDKRTRRIMVCIMLPVTRRGVKVEIVSAIAQLLLLLCLANLLRRFFNHYKADAQGDNIQIDDKPDKTLK